MSSLTIEDTKSDDVQDAGDCSERATMIIEFSKTEWSSYKYQMIQANLDRVHNALSYSAVPDIKD